MKNIVRLSLQVTGGKVRFKENKCEITKETEKSFSVEFLDDRTKRTVRKAMVGILNDDLFRDTAEMFARRAWVYDDDIERIKELFINEAEKHFERIINGATGNAIAIREYKR